MNCRSALHAFSMIDQRLRLPDFHPLNADIESLPVQGYSPATKRWRPIPAAVLVALVLDEQPHILLTVRNQAMARHGGQVALPGGRAEPGEAFPVATALREASEEVGLDPAAVELLGLLDRFDTITGYRISPVVGVVREAPRWQACPQEVAQIFGLPLDSVFDPSSFRRHEIRRGGSTHEAWTMKSGCRPIWGATAAILRCLAAAPTPARSTRASHRGA